MKSNEIRDQFVSSTETYRIVQVTLAERQISALYWDYHQSMAEYSRVRILLSSHSSIYVFEWAIGFVGLPRLSIREAETGCYSISSCRIRSTRASCSLLSALRFTIIFQIESLVGSLYSTLSWGWKARWDVEYMRCEWRVRYITRLCSLDKSSNDSSRIHVG